MAARQFRSDDTASWNHKYGYASDDTYTSATATWNPTRQSCSGSSGQADLTIASGAFSNNDIVIIHQSRGTGAGNWELNRISSGGGTTTLTMEANLINTYTDSGASQAQVVKIYEYSDFTLNSGHTITLPAWDGNKGGIMAIACTGTCTIAGTITGAGKGYNGTGAVTGKPGDQGEGTSGAGGTDNTSANGNGGGGGGNNAGTANGGGGGGGNGTAGGQGANSETNTGSTAGNAGLTNMVFGGAGGEGGDGSSVGAGQEGGGIVFIIAKILTITGAISLNGTAGSSGGAGAGGGGGAGGSVLIKAITATLGSGKITATGGSGGSGSTGAGGAGGVGRIHLDYLATKSGTTSPTLDSRQDFGLRIGASSSTIFG